MNRTMTAKEIAAETERHADARAAEVRRYVVDVLTRGGRFTVESAEAEVRAIEDAVRRDCARRCAAVREELRSVDPWTYARVAPILSRVEDIATMPPTFTAPTVYRGPAAGADACVCAIVDAAMTVTPKR